MPASNQDYYAVLGLASDASDDAIRAAYKRRVRTPSYIYQGVSLLSNVRTRLYNGIRIAIWSGRNVQHKCSLK